MRLGGWCLKFLWSLDVVIGSFKSATPPHAVEFFFRDLCENFLVGVLLARASLLPRPLKMRFAGKFFCETECDGGSARRAAEVRAGFFQRVIRQPDRLGFMQHRRLAFGQKQNPFAHA